MGQRQGNVRFIVRPLVGDDVRIADDVPDYLWSKQVLELLYNLEGELAPHGWDKPPLFGWVYLRGQVRDTPAFLLGSYVEISWMHPMTEHMVRAGRPWHPFVMLGDGLREHSHVPRPDDLIGTVFVTEGWMLTGESDTEEWQRKKEVVRKHEIHKHPDRVEVRMLHMADRDRVHYFVQRERDGIMRHSATVLGKGFVGDVPNALHYVTQAALHGDAIPPWEEWSKLYDYDAD